MTLLSQTPPALIMVMSGNLKPDGELDHVTELKLRQAMVLGKAHYLAGNVYFYVFPDSRRVGDLRVCDVMKKFITKADGCQQGVHVPESGKCLDTFISRQGFANEVRSTTNSRMCRQIT